MIIRLQCDPLTPPLSWEKFITEKKPYSIALDGYVFGGPKYELKGPWLSFNHHEEVDRLATRATCGQVLMAIKQGLFNCLQPKDDQPQVVDIWVNDCDEDVCMSWFLLRHWSMVEKQAYLRLTRLVNIADTLDSTAGAYPYPKDLPILTDLAWIFDPYRVFRISGKLDKLKTSEAYGDIIQQVEDRIMLYITGQGEQLALDCRYKVLSKEDSYLLVEETGAQSKTGMFADGIKAYVSVRERPNSSYTYTIGRLSPFITKFNIPAMFIALNEAEALTSSEDKWGGGNTIGGSPRVKGSKLTPKEVTKIINEVIGKE